ncbi:MAG: hypothetical protein WB660_26775 [Candidatus Sulfotelmatobacter sp.]
MESLKIVFFSIAAGVLYGVIHDQITVRICPEYFTVFHPPLLPIDFPAPVVTLAWGVVATWWARAILGIALAIAARAGARAKLAARDMLPLIALLLPGMAASAGVFGIAGFLFANKGMVSPPSWVQARLDPSRFPNFMADWWAHSASYGAAFLGGAILCVIAYRERRGAKAQAASMQGAQ